MLTIKEWLNAMSLSPCHRVLRSCTKGLRVSSVKWCGTMFQTYGYLAKQGTKEYTVSVTCCLTKGVRNKHMYPCISANRNKKDKIETNYMFMGEGRGGNTISLSISFYVVLI